MLTRINEDRGQTASSSMNILKATNPGAGKKVQKKKRYA